LGALEETKETILRSSACLKKVAEMGASALTY
jgi:hypothetical protein